MNRFGLDSFFLRFIIAAVVAFATYNAEGFSYFHWILNNLGSLNLYMAGAAVVLVLCWIMLIRSSIASLSLIGFSLVTVAFALLAWFIIHRLGLNASSKGAIIYIIELAIASVLSVGVPWSRIKRKFLPQPSEKPVDKKGENKISQATSSDQAETETTQKIPPPVDYDATQLIDKSE
jgi:glucan phosphoethanolaminetransferase (alkaline phosphatase superfamily)